LENALKQNPYSAALKEELKAFFPQCKADELVDVLRNFRREEKYAEE